MARAMSASTTPVPSDGQAMAGPADVGGGGCTGPLLYAVAVQRPTSELIQLVSILNESRQLAHAQEILDTAAVLRPVQDVAEMVPLLPESQALQVLHVAAARRPVEELAHLVTLFTGADQLSHAQEILTTAATLRPVQEVAAMVPLLGDSGPAAALHAAAACRPLGELAELVGHLDNLPQAAPDTRQPRRRLRR
ncbi:hypothetical protein ABH925_000429 [Streptacidiphilus sp. EB129]